MKKKNEEKLVEIRHAKCLLSPWNMPVSPNEKSVFGAIDLLP